MFFFSRKPAFGINISDYSIEVISLAGSFYAPKLIGMGRKIILGKGLFEDGRILRPKETKNVISELVQEPQFGKMGSRNIIFTVPESVCFMHRFETEQDLQKEDLEERIRFEMKELFPFKPKELLYDYEVRGRQIFVVAVPKIIMQEYFDVFRACHLNVVAAEPESKSLGRVLFDKDTRLSFVLDIGARVTNIALFSKGSLEMSFTIQKAGNHFTKALAEHLKVSLNRAGHLKREVGMSVDKENGKVFAVLQKEMESIVKELQEIVRYVKLEFGADPTKFVLAGGSSAMPFIKEYFEGIFSNGVEIADPWVRIDIELLKGRKYYDEALSVSPILYTTAIGSALRGLSKTPEKEGINLVIK